MQTATLNDPPTPPAETSLSGKLLNVLLSPGEVFEETAVTPPRVSNWLVPTLLTGVAGLLLVRAVAPAGQNAPMIGQWLALQLTTLAATCWSAFVLWCIGRVFLKTRFQFLKSVEVVAWSGVVLALGSVVTALLVQVSGDPLARPALSLFADRASASPRLLAVLDALNAFHLWTTLVLTIGFAKLSGVSLKESCFWIFGYWVLLRLALILLA